MPGDNFLKISTLNRRVLSTRQDADETGMHMWVVAYLSIFSVSMLAKPCSQFIISDPVATLRCFTILRNSSSVLGQCKYC